MKDAVQQEKDIALYSDILSVAFKHGYKFKEYGPGPQMELRRMHASMRFMRDGRRHVEPTLHVKKREALLIESNIRRLTNKRVRLTLGSNITARKEALLNTIEVTVGHMWRHKIWNKFYALPNNLKSQLILTADKVKVNNKLLDVYDVLVFNMDNGSTKRGYISVTRGERQRTFFAYEATKSIKKAMNSINRELDQKLKGEL